MSPHHLLYVDDDPFVHQIVAHGLQPDFQVTALNDGSAAMAWLQAGHRPDLILTDLRMPQGDGRQLIDFVKHSPAHRLIPICVLSASHDSPLIIACLEAGADDFISKPFSPHFVKAKLAALLRLGSATSSSYDNAS